MLIAAGVHAQNTCATAVAIGYGQYAVEAVVGEVLNASCNGAQITDAAQWYTFTPEADANITISSAIAPYNDTRLLVFTGSCEGLVCNNTNDDAGPGYSSILTIEVQAGTTYYIVWDAFWNANGFNFSITETVVVPSLINFDYSSLGISAISAADMNGDKLDDVLQVGGFLNMLLQQEDGTFESASIPYNNLQNSPSWSLAAGDMNNDGWSDLVCGGGGGVSILLSQNDGADYTEFTVSNYVFSQRSNCVDLDNDGLLDAFVCHDVAPNVRFINQGNGTFQFSQGGLGDTPDGGNYGSVWIDYDNDCDMDLFIAKCRGGLSEASRNQLHRNNGDGTFTEVSDESNMSDYVQTWSSAWADYDNDGDMDAVIGASSFSTGIHRVMRNNGDGTFTDVVTGSGFDTFGGTGIEWAPADFNNDGLVDVIGANGYIAVNNGDFNFSLSPVDVAPGPLGDLNNDGFIDVLGGNGVYYNEGNENNYVKFALVGTESNPQGIGARITVYTADGQQIRDVRSGEGFRYMSSLNAHFGIGSNTEIIKATICWPSGIEDEIPNPDINTLHIIEEGSFVVNVNENDMQTLEIFPNPAQDVLSFKNAQDLIGAMVFVYDATGKMIQSQTFTTNQVDVSALPAGYYVLRLKKGEKEISSSFMKN